MCGWVLLLRQILWLFAPWGLNIGFQFGLHEYCIIIKQLTRLIQQTEEGKFEFVTSSDVESSSIHSEGKYFLHGLKNTFMYFILINYEHTLIS